MQIYQIVTKSILGQDDMQTTGWPPSGYYAWRKTPVSNHAKQNARLLQLMRASLAGSQPKATVATPRVMPFIVGMVQQLKGLIVFTINIQSIFTRCFSMKHRIAITLATILFSMNAMAQSDASDVLISVEYGSADADYEISGTDFDGDLDLIVVSARYYLSDNAYFSVGSSSGDGTISNVSFDSTGLSVGAGAKRLRTGSSRWIKLLGH
jgi:hypothetical protein